MSIDEKTKQERIDTKRDRFHRIATQRTNTVLNGLRLLGNCGNRFNYEYTEAEVKQMFDAIDEAVKAAKQRYSFGEQKDDTFRFKDM